MWKSIVLFAFIVIIMWHWVSSEIEIDFIIFFFGNNWNWNFEKEKNQENEILSDVDTNPHSSNFYPFRWKKKCSYIFHMLFKILLCKTNHQGQCAVTYTDQNSTWQKRNNARKKQWLRLEIKIWIVAVGGMVIGIISKTQTSIIPSGSSPTTQKLLKRDLIFFYIKFWTCRRFVRFFVC